jgi:hypothetical protein
MRTTQRSRLVLKALGLALLAVLASATSGFAHVGSGSFP